MRKSSKKTGRGGSPVSDYIIQDIQHRIVVFQMNLSLAGFSVSRSERSHKGSAQVTTMRLGRMHSDFPPNTELLFKPHEIVHFRLAKLGHEVLSSLVFVRSHQSPEKDSC